MSDRKKIGRKFFEDWNFVDENETRLKMQHELACDIAALAVNSIVGEAVIKIDDVDGRTTIYVEFGDSDNSGELGESMQTELAPALFNAVEFEELLDDESPFRERLASELEAIAKALRSKERPTHTEPA